MSGYTIRRFEATTGVAQNAAGGCFGTIALPRTESSVPAAPSRTLSYRFVASWCGAESAKSATIGV